MIDSVGGFLEHNLVVLLAVVLVPMKWVILRVCGDSEAQSVALLSIPEDICYVALGIVLGDMTNAGGAFRKYFHGSSHIAIDVFVTASFNIIVAIVVHLLSKWGNDHFNGWRAAQEARKQAVQTPGASQIVMPGIPTAENLRRIQVQHLIVFSLCYAVQLVIVIRWLAWIAKVVGNA